jgi:hypothetical protein
MQRDRRERRHGEHASLAVRPEVEAHRRGLQLRANLLGDRIDALCREETCVGNVACIGATGQRHRQRPDQCLPVRGGGPILRLAEVEVVAEVRHRERAPVRGMHATRDDEQVCRVLRELFVALHVQGVVRRLPLGLIDADDAVVGADEKDVLARDRRQVDRPRERDRDPRLDVEAVERVEDRDVLAIADARRAVRRRQLDAKTRHLGRIGRCVEVGRKRLAG